MKKSFYSMIEEKIRLAQKQWEESRKKRNNTVYEEEIKELKSWLIESVQEQFLSKIPDAVGPDSTLRIETKRYAISVRDEGYRFANKALFHRAERLYGFLFAVKEELTEIVDRKVEYEIDDDTPSGMLVKFYFYW